MRGEAIRVSVHMLVRDGRGAGDRDDPRAPAALAGPRKTGNDILSAM